MKNNWISKKIIYFIILVFLLPLIYLLIKAQYSGGKTLILTSWGGSYQQSEREAYFIPFEKESGIKIIEDTYSWDYAKIEQIVKSRNIVWDIVEVETPFMIKGINKKLFEKLDFDKISKNKFIPSAINDYALAVECWSVVLAWNTNNIKGLPEPTNWSDLWDIKKYPGKRGFEKRPQYVLEVALLADGVKYDSLYPLDVNRALSKLEQIKDYIVWWSNPANMQELLKNGDVTLSEAWNGRIWSLKRNNENVNFTMKNGILDWTWWVILKGSKNLNNAYSFLESTSDSSKSRIIMEQHGYGSPLVDAPKLSQDEIQFIPVVGSNQDLIPFNAQWWFENEEKILPLWEKWLLNKF